MKIRVYYEDTDAGGIVYHANYIKYCERARSELFFAQGLKPLEGEESGFIVSRIQADFLSSAVLGDLLEVKTSLMTLKRSTVVLRQEIYRDHKKLFVMEVRLAYISEGKISRIPESFVALLGSL